MSESSVQRVMVTPQMAQSWLESSKYLSQRPVSNEIVQKYADDMARGLWMLSNDNIVIGIRPTGEHLLNGQHRLNAVIRSGLPQLFNVDRMTFSSDVDMDLCYALMDQGKRRSFADSVRALGTADLIGISPTTATAAAAAMLLAAAGFRRNMGTYRAKTLFANAKVKHDVMVAWKTPIYAYCRNIQGASGKTRNWFMRAPVMAVGIVTMRWTPEKATDFWYRLSNNDGLLKGTPEHALYEILTNFEVSQRGADWYSRAVANCWNAFMQNRPLNIVRVYREHESSPILIKGTPWDGSEVDSIGIIGIKQ
jgi:hypothetical protein